MFKSIGGFFRDIVAPIGIGLAFGPGAAAVYSGINTGIRTGSPLAGIGSAGLSLAASSAFNKLSEGFKSSLGFVSDPSKIAPTGGSVFAKGAQGIQSGSINPFTGASLTATGTGSFAPNIGSVVARTPTMVPQSSLFGGTTNVFNPAGVTPTGDFVSGIVSPEPGVGTFVKSSAIGDLPLFSGPGAEAVGLPSTTVGDLAPDFIAKQSPLTVGGAGLALQTVATPPPEPAPFVPMQPQRRTTDLSKYGYKGPLDRGEYTYADPEDIAYGRATPDSYGYLGAKEGGKIKAQGGGVMMQSGPYNPQIEAQKGTFRPTGSLVPPTAGPSISRLAQTQPMMSMSPQKTKGLAQPVAPTVPTNMPMSSPTPMMPPQGPMLPQGGGGLAPQPTREPLPQVANNAQKLIDQLPQKDINVNIDQIRQFIGLAKGGEVPGMSEQAPAGATGPSSGLGVYNTSPKMSEAEFVDFVGNDMFKGNFIGRAVAELKGPELYKQLDKQGAFKMAEGGEVNSDKTLQENAFVIPADVVGHIGDGSSDAGAQRLQSYLGMNPQQYQAGGIMAGELQGPGGGMDDLIQTSIEGKRAAAVSPQEFVVPRDIVAELGQGSYDKGSNKLYALMRNVRKTKTGTTKQPAELTRGLGQLMRTAIG